MLNCPVPLSSQLLSFVFISYYARGSNSDRIYSNNGIQQWKIRGQNNKTLETIELVTNFNILNRAVAVAVEGSILRTCLDWVASNPKL